METKFRAFQLDSAGSLFSYWKKNTYTLIEARLPKEGINILIDDLAYHDKDRIDVLHITSWDADHCQVHALTQILNHFRPDRIEIPSYEPDNDTARQCKGLIMKYDHIHQKYVHNVTRYDQATIGGLSNASSWGTNNVVYHSLYNVDNHNDMSQIRLFRSDGFSVLSLGDCESEEITEKLMRSGSILSNEVDVLILPHHGSENSMLNGAFLDFCKPGLAVCSSNFGNQFEHPRPAVKQLLTIRNIKTMTTKRGDVIVIQKDSSGSVDALNLATNNTIIEDQYKFWAKKAVHNIVS
tara:strand:- start:5865 stop:6749 length:885 start_codon:yes stop_codon:yes gene_type:complete